jgi:hypothetical protein
MITRRRVVHRLAGTVIGLGPAFAVFGWNPLIWLVVIAVAFFQVSSSPWTSCTGPGMVAESNGLAAAELNLHLARTVSQTHKPPGAAGEPNRVVRPSLAAAPRHALMTTQPS